MAKREQKVILNNGAMQHLLTIPAEGLLMRVQINGRKLAASFPEGEGAGQPGTALQMITWAISSQLQVDPILDEDNPFNAYNPGVVAGNAAPRRGEPSRSEAGKATT